MVELRGLDGGGGGGGSDVAPGGLGLRGFDLFLGRVRGGLEAVVFVHYAVEEGVLGAGGGGEVRGWVEGGGEGGHGHAGKAVLGAGGCGELGGVVVVFFFGFAAFHFALQCLVWGAVVGELSAGGSP